jgi:hypothetical protein
MSFQPEPVDLDALANSLASLTETQRQAVVEKAGATDTANRKAKAAQRLRDYLSGGQRS